MKINAIIAEYNPLHKGHIYQMEHAKTSTGADYTVVLMSGNFVQRGAPAIMDKHVRAKMAIEAGADLVLELPTGFCASSAELFATGAVGILTRLGVVDTLCFGSEIGDLKSLQSIAEILVNEPAAYKSNLKKGLSMGKSYPQARNEALFSYAPSLFHDSGVMTSPNNILAIEYLKAIYRQNSPIQPFTTTRTQGGYHNNSLNVSFASAKAIREAIYSSGTDKEMLIRQLPELSADTFREYFKKYSPVTTEDFSDLLYMALLENNEKGYSQFADVSYDLSNKIKKNLMYYQGFDEFCNLLKSKELTYTRIARCLFHILLGITKDELENPLLGLSYVRVLGFRKASRALLTEIDLKSSLKMVTKPADAGTLLSQNALSHFEKQLAYDKFYYYIQGKKAAIQPINEYTIPLTIL